MKSYAVEITITNKETLEQTEIYEEYATKLDALERKESIIENMDRKIEFSTWKKVYPVVKCCGVNVPCMNFTNTCNTCGSDYNFNGELLAPRSHWGEETGEIWEECY